ncbi:mucin-2-like [Osmia bicornis bicornis]|uniref:mucin-2-like n=1 Tax=Osmia bicornis bicornis TaxID=1437191 RepID=UPI001EAF1603|nr:mucin-2-like [Osmia bicornis bicornis]
MKVAVYQRHEDLGKHLRLHHHGASRRWVCGVCFFTDDSAYALKKVRKHHADSHANNAVPRAAGARTSAPAGRVSGGAPPAGGDLAEERSYTDVALPETTQRPSPSPLEATAPTTRGGALTRAKKSTLTNTRTTVAAKPSNAPKRKPVITSTVTGRNLLTGWAIKKTTATTTTRKSGTPSSPADGRPPSTGSPATPPTVDLTTPPPAGIGAAKRISGGSVSMRRPSGGSSTTLTPPTKEKEKSPGTKRRCTRATTEPPQPDPPQRTAARKVTPAVTYAEVTRGTSTVTTTMTTRRMARASSLPPVPRNEGAGGASTTQAPPTMPVTATCTFATAGTLTLTTTSVYSKPVAVVTVATRRSGGGISPRGLKKKIQEDTVLLESAPTTRARAARATTEPPRTPPRTTRTKKRRSPPADMGPATVSDTATPTTPEERPVTRRSTRAKTLSPGSTQEKRRGDGTTTLPSPATGRPGRRRILPAIAEASSPAVTAAPIKEKGKEKEKEQEEEEKEECRDFTPRNRRRRAGRREEEGVTTTPSPRTQARQPPRIRNEGAEVEVVRVPRVVEASVATEQGPPRNKVK